MRFIAMRLFCVGLLCTFFMAGPLSAAAAQVVFPAGTLDDKQLGELVFGKTIVAKSQDNRMREIYFSPQHEVRQVSNNDTYLEGKWKVRKGRLCVTLSGDRDCRIVVKENERYRTYIVKKNNRHIFEEEFVSINSGDGIKGKLSGYLQGKVALPDGTLNANDVYDLFVGKTVESVTAAKGRRSFSYYHPDGKVLQERKGEKRTGKWRVKKNGRICLQMEGLPEKCRIIVKDGREYKKYIVKKNGQHVHSVSYPKFRKGNTEGL